MVDSIAVEFVVYTAVAFSASCFVAETLPVSACKGSVSDADLFSETFRSVTEVQRKTHLFSTPLP